MTVKSRAYPYLDIVDSILVMEKGDCIPWHHNGKGRSITAALSYHGRVKFRERGIRVRNFIHRDLIYIVRVE